MAEPLHEWQEEDRHSAVPMFTPSELEEGLDKNTTTNNEGFAASFGKKAPRLLYGDNSRFGMVKDSIAARKANADAAAAATASAAAKTRRPQTGDEVPKLALTLNSQKVSLQSGRATVHNVVKAPVIRMEQSNSRQQEFAGEEENRVIDNTIHFDKERRQRDVKEEEEEDENEDEEARNLLGPMGSFYELSTVSSAADLIRTASHDKSSHSVSQARGLRQANVPAAYSDVASTDYYRPSDRIGRLYTSTAAALTSTSAQAVAKAAATLAVAAGALASTGSSGGAGGIGGGGGGGLGRTSTRARNNDGGGKLVTAPFAAESREILQTLALQPASTRGKLAATLTFGNASPPVAGARLAKGGEEGEGRRRGNQSPSPTRAGATEEVFEGGLRSPGSPGQRQKKLVVIESAQDTRTQLREMRSPPRGRRLLDVAPSSGGGARPSSDGVAPASGSAATASDEGGGFAVKYFRSWNPAILEELKGDGRGGGGGSGQHGALNSSESSISTAAGGDNRGGERVAVKAMGEAERQKDSIDRYWIAVEDRMLNGSPNALGAGAKSPLFELPPERVDGITSRLAFELRFIPGIELGAYQAYVESAVNAMLQDVQVGHAISVARAVVDYELKDAEGRRVLGIEQGHLTAGPRWYQSQEYLIPEWRVLRQTGVSRARVRRFALALKRKLCSVETIMVGLEKLWHSGVVPGDWDTAAFGGSRDMVGGLFLKTTIRTISVKLV